MLRNDSRKGMLGAADLNVVAVRLKETLRSCSVSGC